MNMYLLDTNALSELMKKRPRSVFLARLRRHPTDVFFTSTMCVMELRYGSRRGEDHATFWARITHEILARVTILDFGVPSDTVAFVSS
jgi:predicted nucleic acid-binding protein